MSSSHINQIRIIAADFRGRILGETGRETLATAEQVLAAADAETGMARIVLGAGDLLLAGAQAVLDRDAQTIWQSDDQPLASRAFDAAHEYGHLVLHSGSRQCVCSMDVDSEIDDEGAPSATQTQVDGYSAKQRQEYEANVFAAEFLLPPCLLRKRYVLDQSNALEIARELGLSERFVRARFTTAILAATPHGRAISNETTPPTSTKLDTSQLAAAQWQGAPLLLGAGPGTGKTRTLVARCEHLVNRDGVPAESILALTFSCRAAEEMRQRLIDAGIGSREAGPWIGTFHAFGLELLRRYGHYTRLKPGWRLLDSHDTFLLLEQNIDSLGLDELTNIHTPTLHLPEIISAIARAKDELCRPRTYKELAADMVRMAGDELKEFRQGARTTEAANVYISYEKLLAGANSIDYGDLINLPIELLQSRPDVAAMLRRQYPYVLADEYQDVNRACARLLQLLAGPDGRNLWVVGDHRQSIYRFRGASPANMSGFQIDYPAGVRQELANNYRSCAPIVSLCSAAARCMHGANHAQSNDGWRSARAELEAGSAPRISMAVTDSDEAQAEGIANRIADFRCQGIPYSEQAILCRTHYQANALAKLLAKCGAPVHYAQGLLDRPEARDLLAVLQASIPSKSSVIALQRVATISDVGLSPIQGALLVRLTAETGLSALDAIQRSEVEDVFGEIPGFQKLRQLLHVLKDEIDPARCLERFVFHESSYLADLLGAEGASAPRDLAEQAQICAIRQTIELARMFTGSRRRLDPASAPHADMRVSFLEYVRRLMASGSQPALNLGDDLGGFDSVAMITVHAAKGLEFPVVFVPNLSEGRFPPRSREPLIAEPPGMAQDNSGDGDEQCLFFVAISRAREHLVLSRSTSSGDATLAPSRLITLIDGGLHELGITETRWADTQTRDAPEREVHADVNPVGKPVFTSSQLTAYLQCPRQYYYSRLGLDMAVDHPATVQQVPKTLQAALTRERIRPVRQPNRLIARFDTVHICVEADMIACDVEGRLVIAKHLMGKPQDRDQADPLLALYRRAADDSAPSQPSRIEIHYLSTGDRRVVARSKKYEPGRLLKFVEAAAALEHGEYPARPAEPGLCARCPYLVACPT